MTQLDTTTRPWRRRATSGIIEVYADVRCPFAHLGLRRFVERRDEIGAHLPLRVRAWPLELVNANPLNPWLIADEVEELREQVSPELFSGFSLDHFPPSSIPAMAMTDAAYGIGADTGEAIAFAVRWAMFEHGLDISDLDVLAEIGHPFGVEVPPADEQLLRVLDEWHRGQAHGVVGSPHFFSESGDLFCPALDISKLGGRRQIVDRRSRLDDFIDRALTSARTSA